MVILSVKPTLICTIWTEKLYNPESFKAQMKSIWKPKKKFEIQTAGQNLFLIVFELEEYLELIMEGRLRLFRKSLILFDRVGYGLVDCSELNPAEKIKIREDPPYMLALKAESNLIGKESGSEVEAIKDKIIGKVNSLKGMMHERLQSSGEEKMMKKQEEVSTVMKDEQMVETKSRQVNNLNLAKKASWKRIAPVQMMTQRKDESCTRKRKASEDKFEICSVEAAYEDGTKRLKKIEKRLELDGGGEATEQQKKELVDSTFPVEVAEKILRIPLAKELNDNFLAWRGESSGEFTVRNAYKLVQGIEIDPRAYALQNGIFYCALWAIWGEMNKRVHEKANRSGKKIASFIKRHIYELNGIEEKVPNILTGVRKWKHPPGQFVNINFDAAYDGNLCQSAVGIVARDSEGNILLSFTEIHHLVVSAFAAKAIACRTTTQIGIDMQWSNIIIEGDALSIIKKCKIKSHDKSMVGAYIQDIHQVLAKSKKYCFEHIPRAANSLAHTLATETLKKKDEIYLIGRVPEYAENLKEKEKTRELD
ncbi:hypothetical protein GOBAR_DD25653 [Gossypium barbadense]|nr:hypothetical protein GOBAR_DD25653 [Gossypium barbadense]